MSTQNFSTTRDRVSAVSPAHWLREFIYTPGSARVAHGGGYRSPTAKEGQCTPASDEHSDTLPMQFPALEGPECSLGYASDSVSRLTVPRKRKWSNPGGELPTLFSSGAADDLSMAGPFQAPVRRTGSRSRRVAPDAVEILTKSLEHDPLPSASKYSAHVSSDTTCFAEENLSALTPPSSPVLTIPVYIKSSDFEHPPSDEALRSIVDKSQGKPSWYSTPGLFEDFMIMLRRLKPILIQDCVRDDPWKVLIAVRLLNVTTGKAAIPVFFKILSRWPTPKDLAHASQNELVELLRPLGLYNKRARWLKDMSECFIEDQQRLHCSQMFLASCLSERTVPAVSSLQYPGIGSYALDSLRIFCASDDDAWKYVMPQDKELVRYLRWRWAVEDGKMWYPGDKGVIGDVNVPYLVTLADELAVHYDSAIGGEGYLWHFHNDLAGVLTDKMKG